MFVNNLYISCASIGPGLYIEHGFSSVIYANSIGRNFHVNQMVTIGQNRGGIPTIGDNVSVYSHAVVMGPISVGNHVKVGAGAVLFESVGPNVTVVSQKPRYITR